MPNRAYLHPRGRSVALLCALALPLVAGNCGKKHDTIGEPLETGDTGVTPVDFWEIASLYGAANLDDDDENGGVDWDDGASGSDNDLAELNVPAGVGALTVTLEGVIDGVADQTQVLTGTWVLVPNENYIENYGDYLVFDIDAQDGAALDEPIHWVDLMVIRHELLLLAPKVRAF